MNNSYKTRHNNGKSVYYKIHLLFRNFSSVFKIFHFLFVFTILLQIKKFNLEIASFVKELNSYIENVNEINDETEKLMIETIESVNKLQKKAQFCEISSNESGLVNNLNNDVFECRRCIVCRLCSVSNRIFSRFIYNENKI